MLRLQSTLLESGMVTALPISNPQRPKMNLLNTDVLLEERAIERLQSLGVRHVWVHHPSLDFLDARLKPEISAQRQQIYESIKNTFTNLSSKTAATNISFNEYRVAVTNLVESLVVNSNHAMMIEQLSAGNGNEVNHGASVAYLSAMLGIQMESYLVRQRARLSAHHAREVVNLGIGAMLHDIGKLGQPEEFARMHVMKEGAADDPRYQEHCRRGYELVQGRLEASASQIILNHHQRFDGNGFPPRKDPDGNLLDPQAGTKIHIFSRIVGLVDAFDRLRVSPEGHEWPPIRALYELQNERLGGWFDPIIFRGFYELVPAFGIGTVVTLSNSYKAVVCSFNPRSPCQPTITLYADAKGRVLDGNACEKIDLAGRSDMHITHVDDLDVTPFRYELPALPIEQLV